MDIFFRFIILLLLTIFNEKAYYKIMFRFIKKIFIRILSFGGSLAMECVSISFEPCQPKHSIIDINSNEPIYYPFCFSVNKCIGSCNTIDNPYAQTCVPNKVKNMNLKVFNLIL